MAKKKNKPVILILGDHDDPHIDAVTDVLRKLEHEYLRLDPYGDVELPFLEGRPRLSPNLKLSAIWDRVKWLATAGLTDRDEYIIRERKQLLQAFAETSVNGCRHMNHPDATAAVKSKAKQLNAASRFGFQIPNTFIGNNATALTAFMNRHDVVVAKSLTWYYDTKGSFTFTNIVTPSSIPYFEERLALSPMIFQEYIQKKYELRATCVGKKIFGVKIYSQESQAASIDWRRDQFGICYEAIDLPAKVQESILRMQGTWGLNYGAYDFIVSPQNEYYFLEVNSMGNWLWLENEAGVPISQQIGEWLAGDFEVMY